MLPLARSPRERMVLHRAAVAAALVGIALTAGCGGSSSAATTPSAASTLRLGYFANVTHAGPVYGVATGIYQAKLGSTKLKTQVFNAGPAAVEALFGGAIDAAYL